MNKLVNLLIALALLLAALAAGSTLAAARLPEKPAASQAVEAFRIVALTADNSAVVDHLAVTGDDRGGIATSNTRLFYSGDTVTGRFSLDDLSGGTGIGARYDTLIGDLKSGQVYLLGNGGSPIPTTGGNQTVTQLLEVDGDTGAMTGGAVTLTPPIVISTNTGAGLFAGYGRVVIYDPNIGNVWSIATPSGIVASLAYPGALSVTLCENWAFWGMAEHFGGQDYVVYRDTGANHNIVRTRLSGGATTVLADFSNLGDMCSIAANVARGRWYFHHEYSSQFGGSFDGETAGYADAVFDTTVEVYHIYIPLVVRNH